MPITIHQKHNSFYECYTFARTFYYQGLNPHYIGNIEVKLAKIKCILKTPSRINVYTEVRNLLGPFKKMQTNNDNGPIKWKTKNIELPIVYRKFSITQKINLPDNYPPIKKITKYDIDILVNSAKFVHGRLIINYNLCSKILYIQK